MPWFGLVFGCDGFGKCWIALVHLLFILAFPCKSSGTEQYSVILKNPVIYWTVVKMNLYFVMSNITKCDTVSLHEYFVQFNLYPIVGVELKCRVRSKISLLLMKLRASVCPSFLCQMLCCFCPITFVQETCMASDYSVIIKTVIEKTAWVCVLECGGFSRHPHTCVGGVMSECHAWCMVSHPSSLPFTNHALRIVKNINSKLIQNFLLLHSELIP